jgi:hypothetical protein
MLLTLLDFLHFLFMHFLDLRERKAFDALAFIQKRRIFCMNFYPRKRHRVNSLSSAHPLLALSIRCGLLDRVI